MKNFCVRTLAALFAIVIINAISPNMPWYGNIFVGTLACGTVQNFLYLT